MDRRLLTRMGASARDTHPYSGIGSLRLTSPNSGCAPAWMITPSSHLCRRISSSPSCSRSACSPPNRPDISDGVAVYLHFLNGNGADFVVDYDAYVESEQGGKRTLTKKRAKLSST
jgi:hypothetical protein